MPRVVFDYPVDKLSLALGYAVFFSRRLQLSADSDVLAEHRTGYAVGVKQLGYLCGQALPEPFTAADNAYQDGVCVGAYIPLAEHGADERIHGHVKCASGKVHVAYDPFGIGIHGSDLKHALLAVDVYLDPRIHVKRNR